MRPFDDSLFLTPEQRFRSRQSPRPGPVAPPLPARGFSLFGEHPSPKNLRILVQLALRFLAQTVLSVHKG